MKSSPETTSRHTRTNAARTPLTRVVNLHKAFGSNTVLNGVSLEFMAGETTVVLGPSGTGKSVLLKHIVGLLRPDAGEVYFHDQRVDQLKEPALVAIRTRIGFLFQMGALFDSRTVYENVEFPLHEHAQRKRRERRDQAEKVLRMVGLPDIGRKMPGDLSGGQRKRVALARAIVLEPELMLYDEPTTGLDPITADLINELIVTLAENLGVTSIAVTHDMVSARKIGDRMVLLHSGKVIADEAADRFVNLEDEQVQHFIQGKADDEDLRRIREGFQSLS